jgi:glutathione S-transferase
MPKLYYTTTSCGAASYLALTIGGVKFDSEVVDIRAGTCEDGSDFEAVSWKGSVPALVLDDNVLLSENVATLIWASDNAVKKWGPTPGTTEHYQMIDHLAYVNSTIHRSFGPLFYPGSEEAKQEARAKLVQNLEWCFKFIVKDKKFLGTRFTVADIYLFITLTWAGYVGVTLPAVAVEYLEAIKAIDGVGSTYAAINTPKA